MRDTARRFDDFTPLILTGDLEGCLYSEILTATTTPSGVYHETGRELVVASLNGGPTGRFTTTYKFEAKLDTTTGAELKGRCQHPITKGSGTGGFAGATGRLGFKDLVDLGHVRLPGAHHARLTQTQHHPRSVVTTGRGKPPPHHVHRAANALTCRDPMGSRHAPSEPSVAQGMSRPSGTRPTRRC